MMPIRQLERLADLLGSWIDDQDHDADGRTRDDASHARFLGERRRRKFNRGPSRTAPVPWTLDEPETIHPCDACGGDAWLWALIEHHGRMVHESCAALDPLGQGGWDAIGR